MPIVNGPSLDGEGESFANYAHLVKLRNRVPNLNPVTRVSAPELRMDPVARQVSTAAGDDQPSDPDGAAKILQVLRDSLAPEAADSIYEVA